jgi:hypothetical protein
MELAIFPDRAHAARAKQIIEDDAGADDDTGAHVELIADPSELTSEKLPLSLTMARSGALIGASALAASFTAGFLGLLGLELGAFEALLLGSPVISILTLALLAALLGGLAGALSFSTELKGKLARFRNRLRNEQALTEDDGPAALVLDSSDTIDGILRDEGALETQALT